MGFQNLESFATLLGFAVMIVVTAVLTLLTLLFVYRYVVVSITLMRVLVWMLPDEFVSQEWKDKRFWKLRASIICWHPKLVKDYLWGSCELSHQELGISVDFNNFFLPKITRWKVI